ncbi:MAG: FkbM family methyltransferase, partial [Candidatus Hodarchaeota archaeon]
LLLLRGILDSSPKEALKFTVFDVGAHIGQWTIFLLNLAQERGIADKITIHCFEPSSFTFSQLRKLLLKHRYGGRICAVNSGMGNAEERRKLYICHNGAGTNSLYKRRLEGHNISYDKSEIVQITTVDAYCYKNNISHVDFMKIDVEGHEQAVVQGAKNMLKQHAIDYIQFEYGGCWIDSRKLLIDMYDFLTSFGYVIGKIMPRGIEFYEKYDQRLENFQMANFLACLPRQTDRFKRVRPWML